MKTTNYQNTFIEIAEDCTAKMAEVPPQKGDKKTVVNYQFELLYDNPYQFTSDEVIFKIHAIRKEIPSIFMEEERQKFFSKGQPCLRASPLGKRYGWGFHYNEAEKIAIYPVESEDYQQFSKSIDLKHTKAMRSKKV
jgi:hypothetical protein